MRNAMFVLVAGLVCPSAVTRADDPPRGRAKIKVVVTSPLVTDVVVAQQDSCRIRSRRFIEVRPLLEGYLETVPVKEGQEVKEGDVLFQIAPGLFKAKLEVASARVRLEELKLNSIKKLFKDKAASEQEVTVAEATLAHAQAEAKQAEAELSFTTVRARYDGFIGRLAFQEGSFVDKKDTLTTLSDCSVMWVYFHVPEARYLEYKSRQGKSKDHSRLELGDSRIELVLADGNKFGHDAGNTLTVESGFNNETGTMSLRADFPNPDRLLRNGQTGTISIRRTVKNATVIPQRSAFELLDRWYVYVLDKDNVVRQREITVQHDLDDLLVLTKGLDENDRIVFEGVRQVRDGDKVDAEFRKPQDAFGDSPSIHREK